MKAENQNLKAAMFDQCEDIKFLKSEILFIHRKFQEHMHVAPAAAPEVVEAPMPVEPPANPTE
jgi:hypothetical protein